MHAWLTQSATKHIYPNLSINDKTDKVAQASKLLDHIENMATHERWMHE